MKQAPAVALSINSPGGSPVQSRLIFNRIRELARENEKKVLMFVEDVGGLRRLHDRARRRRDHRRPDLDRRLDRRHLREVRLPRGSSKKLGVDRRVYTAGENKADARPVPAGKAERYRSPEAPCSSTSTASSSTWSRSAAAQARRRRRPAVLRPVLDRRKGTELGLIDAFGHMDTVITQRFGDKAQLRLIGPRRNLFGRLQPGIGGGRSGWIGSLGAGLAGAVIEALQERALWNWLGL